MTHENEGNLPFPHFPNPVQTLSLKLGIADRQNLIHEHDVGIPMNSDGKSQTDVHSGRISRNGCVQKIANVSKLYNIIHSFQDLPTLAIFWTHPFRLILPEC